MSNGDYLTSLRSWWERSDAEDRQAGRTWYPLARGECYDIAKRYGFSLKRACYAAAALSNNMEWSHNVALLEHVAYSVRDGMQPRGHYARCLHKATRILRHGEWGALRGPKVVPFARALYGDTTAAVVDRWVARAAGLVVGRLTDRRSADIAVALRVLAREVRQSVAVTQAIIWVAVRRAADPTQTPIPF